MPESNFFILLAIRILIPRCGNGAGQQGYVVDLIVLAEHAGLMRDAIVNPGGTASLFHKNGSNASHMLKLLSGNKLLAKYVPRSRRTAGATGEDRQRERRRQTKNSMPHVALQACHTEGSSLLPSRQAMLSKLPTDGVACEIGVSRGDFTADILALNSPTKLHLVDSWDSQRYAADLDKVRATFAAEIATGRVEINRGLSTEALARFDDAYFDWVYIDTNHSYATTAAELEICARKVKPGGRIAGHDFCTGNVITPVPYGVVEACNEFCVREGWRYEFLTLDTDGHFSFCLAKIP